MTICVGHVVLPRKCMTALPHGSTDSTDSMPTTKRQRTEQQQEPSALLPTHDLSVLHVQTWGDTAAMQAALLTYVHHYLRSANGSSARTLPATYAPEVKFGEKAVNDRGNAAVTGRTPSSPSSSPYALCSFSFVPGALSRTREPSASAAVSGPMNSSDAPKHGENKGNDTIEADLLRVLLDVPLPRVVRFADSGISSTVFREKVTGSVGEGAHLPVSSDSAHLPLSANGAVQNRGQSASPHTKAWVRAQPVLVVGAGGIGCELLKVLVLEGFQHIHLLDLDTVDATNLNRQFLFRAEDVGHSKSITARAAVLRWFERNDKAASSTCESAYSKEQRSRSPPTIVAYHDNIKSARFDDDFFSQFAAVLNALDNVSARQHVNRMCMQVHVPLVESGTMGYNGQVQPILRGVYECYDCHPKPPDQKTFAVCTIHARPTTMVHCVHFAKELYETVFGERRAAAVVGESADEEPVATSALQSDSARTTASPKPLDAEKGGSSGGNDEGNELAYLNAIMRPWAAQSPDTALLPTSLLSVSLALLRCLFVDKINELLAMKSSWSTAPPTPLTEEEIWSALCSSTATTTKHAQPSATASPPLTSGAGESEGNGVQSEQTTAAQQQQQQQVQRERVLALSELIAFFLRATAACCSAHRYTHPIGFHKEDNRAMDFIAAVANLRAHVFHIAEQSVEELRTIAGSIVPAIATTNAMVAAGVVQQVYHVLSEASSSSEPAATNVNGAGASVVNTAKEVVRTPQTVYVRRVPQTRRRFFSTAASFWTCDGKSSHGTDTCGVPLSPTPLSPSTAMVPPTTVESPRQKRALRAVHDSYLIHSVAPNPPNPSCAVCATRELPRVTVRTDLHRMTLGDFVQRVLTDRMSMESPSITCASSIIYEEDEYEALTERALYTFAREPSAATHTRVVLLVDGLNKEMEWHVTVIHTPSSSPSTACDEETDVVVEGLREALAVEANLSAAQRSEQSRSDQRVASTEEAHQTAKAKVAAVVSQSPPQSTARAREGEEEEAGDGDGGDRENAVVLVSSEEEDEEDLVVMEAAPQMASAAASSPPPVEDEREVVEIE